MSSPSTYLYILCESCDVPKVPDQGTFGAAGKGQVRIFRVDQWRFSAQQLAVYCRLHMKVNSGFSCLPSGQLDMVNFGGSSR